jgi:hypothetical protein
MLFCEQFYFRFLRGYLAQMKHAQWCNLISLSIAESLTLPKNYNKNDDNNDNNVNNNGVDEKFAEADEEKDIMTGEGENK